VPAGREVAFEMRPIGFMGTPFADTAAIPKGPGAEHRAEGWVELLPAYVAGLEDIEGFSHLYVVWVFDRAEGFSLRATPPPPSGGGGTDGVGSGPMRRSG